MGQKLKAFHTLEREEMTVQQYERYMNAHPYQRSIKAIKCLECGDYIVYCNGEHNVPYFKHSPTHEGHSYCSLYTEGKESTTVESKIRKKLYKEQDISFNFELVNCNDKWKAVLTFPPFDKTLIEENTKNNTIIYLKTDGWSHKEVLLPLDSSHFEIGEIKRIALDGLPSKIKVLIKGKSTSKNISYEMEGFVPNSQIYSSLILQEYVRSKAGDNIDLKGLKSFVCKRNGGHVYTGKHYLVFSYYDDIAKHFSNRNDITISKIMVREQIKSYYVPYDIVFNEVNEFTEKFCADRNCELVEKSDAIILWPPICSKGNYKFYKNSNTDMFVSFQNDTGNLDLYQHETKWLYFKIANLNANPFYVSKYPSNQKEKAKDNYSFDVIESNIGESSQDQSYYFNRGVVIGKYDNKMPLRKHDFVLKLNNQLCKKIFKSKSKIKATNNDELLFAIRYSRQYIELREKDYKCLAAKYKENEATMAYLEHCHEVGTIKKEAIRIMMKGE